MDLDDIILDGCCLLNLYGSGRILQILSALPVEFHIGGRALGEAQWIALPENDERQAIDHEDLKRQPNIHPEVLEGENELQLFVRFAGLMEDGEAEACAIAVSRGFGLATDERKVRRIVSENHPNVRLVFTSELLDAWQNQASLGDSEIARVLTRITDCASFAPPKSDPLRKWWLEHLILS